MIKQIILQAGRKIIDFFAWFELIILFLLLVVVLFLIWSGDFDAYQKISFTVGAILITLVLFFISIMFKYFVYLFIDIRDNTAKIAHTEDEINYLNKKIFTVIQTIIIIVISSCLAGLVLCGIMYLQKTLNNQEDNFLIVTLNREVLNGKNKYLDSIKDKRFGFTYDSQNTKQLKIIAIAPNSSANNEGLAVNDIILKINNYDVSNGYDKEKLLNLTTNAKKLKIECIHNGIKKKLILKKSPFYTDNFVRKLKNTNYPLPYFNSMNFKNNYVSVFYKVYTNPSQDEFVKKGLVCNCKDPKKRNVTLFWYGEYRGNYLINSENYLKNNSAHEEIVNSTSEGGIIWDFACNTNKNWTQEEKKEYLKNTK